MKKTLVAILSVALLLTLFCAQALALAGDVTLEDAPAFSDAKMKNFVGVIPAYTALQVRSYDSYADVYVNGKVYYVETSTLLGGDAVAPYTATLNAGTKVYQRATTSAASYTLKKSGTVKVCAARGNWALVQSTGKRGAYAFVKISKLHNIQAAYVE